MPQGIALQGLKDTEELEAPGVSGKELGEPIRSSGGKLTKMWTKWTEDDVAASSGQDEGSHADHPIHDDSIDQDNVDADGHQHGYEQDDDSDASEEWATDDGQYWPSLCPLS